MREPVSSRFITVAPSNAFFATSSSRSLTPLLTTSSTMSRVWRTTTGVLSGVVPT